MNQRCLQPHIARAGEPEILGHADLRIQANRLPDQPGAGTATAVGRWHIGAKDRTIQRKISFGVLPLQAGVSGAYSQQCCVAIVVAGVVRNLIGGLRTAVKIHAQIGGTAGAEQMRTTCIKAEHGLPQGRSPNCLSREVPRSVSLPYRQLLY